MTLFSLAKFTGTPLAQAAISWQRPRDTLIHTLVERCCLNEWKRGFAYVVVRKFSILKNDVACGGESDYRARDWDWRAPEAVLLCGYSVLCHQITANAGRLKKLFRRLGASASRTKSPFVIL